MYMNARFISWKFQGKQYLYVFKMQLNGFLKIADDDDHRPSNHTNEYVVTYLQMDIEIIYQYFAINYLASHINYNQPNYINLISFKFLIQKWLRCNESALFTFETQYIDTVHNIHEDEEIHSKIQL